MSETTFPPRNPLPTTVDVLIIGGGVNGCGIARDAVGRGLSVMLCEQSDLAQATSSASTKLFHGGLRYLEYYAFRLVREALLERETLLGAMPHISWPLRFVLPHHRGLRPRWMLRAGLFLYDHLGGRKVLPASRAISLRSSLLGEPLKPYFTHAFEYSDCWVDDARLVVLNARDAADRGAHVHTRLRLERAERLDEYWQATLCDTELNITHTVCARAIINAAGPWVEQVLNTRLRQNSTEGVRLVRGSHIVVRKMFDHDQPYIFQQADGRVIFAIPYEQDFTLIGTTDQDHTGEADEAVCTAEEQQYLLEAASAYFDEPIDDADVVWRYSGVRPLYDDHASSASAATREYVLSLTDHAGTLPLLNVFGGKITTYRKLAETALEKLRPYFSDMAEDWTAGVALPGGDFAVDGREKLGEALVQKYAFLDVSWAQRLVRQYGTLAEAMLGTATVIGDLGEHFGSNLTEREVRWLISREWARSADDILWRRTKLGLRLSELERERLAQWLSRQQY